MAARLQLGFGALVLITEVIGVIATCQLNGLSNKHDDAAGDRTPKIALAADMRDSFNNTGRFLRNIVIDGDSTIHEGEKARMAETHANNAAIIETLDATLTLPEARQVFDEIQRLRGEHNRLLDLGIDKVERGESTNDIGKFNVEEQRPLQTNLFKSLDTFAAKQENASSELRDEGTRTAETASALMLGLALTAGLLGGVIGFLISRNLSRTLGAEPDDLAHPLGRLADGDLSHELTRREGTTDSVMAALARAVSAVRQKSDNRHGAGRPGQPGPEPALRWAGQRPAADGRDDGATHRHRPQQHRQRQTGRAAGPRSIGGDGQGR